MKNVLIGVGILVILVVLFILWQTVFSQFVPFFGHKGKVTIDKHTFTVDEATTEPQREKGLSGRGSLAKDSGMIFLFDKPDYYGFWMKEMKFPIDIVYINDDKIVTMYKNVQPPETNTSNPSTVYRPLSPANKVLELPAGSADADSIKEGDTVSFSL